MQQSMRVIKGNWKGNRCPGHTLTRGAGSEICSFSRMTASMHPATSHPQHLTTRSCDHLLTSCLAVHRLLQVNFLIFACESCLVLGFGGRKSLGPDSGLFMSLEQRNKVPRQTRGGRDGGKDGRLLFRMQTFSVHVIKRRRICRTGRKSPASACLVHRELE